MRKKSKMSKASPVREDHFSLINLEKQFFDMPEHIVSRSHQEIEQLRKQEIKIKNGLKKIQLQSERFEQKIAYLKKKNNTDSKKKIAKIRKVLQDSHKSVALLNKSLTDIESIYRVITIRNAKFAALRKMLTHFEKEWKNAGKTKKRKLIKERGRARKVRSN
jgi:hypothetical protein